MYIEVIIAEFGVGELVMPTQIATGVFGLAPQVPPASCVMESEPVQAPEPLKLLNVVVPLIVVVPTVLSSP